MIDVFWQRGCCADHRGQLVAVEIRHADVGQHDRDLVLQQRLERLAGRVGADQLLAELGEDGVVGEQLRRLIVDDEDLDRVRPQGDRHSGSNAERQSNRITGASHIRSADSSWSVLTGLAR